MAALFPLTLIPFVIYNLLGLIFYNGATTDGFAAPLASFAVISGATVTLSSGALLIALGIVFLFAEILKATRTGSASLVDHILSMLVFIAYLVEFLTLTVAANPVFLILTLIAFIDVVAGFSITIRGARRDVDVVR